MSLTHSCALFSSCRPRADVYELVKIKPSGRLAVLASDLALFSCLIYVVFVTRRLQTDAGEAPLTCCNCYQGLPARAEEQILQTDKDTTGHRRQLVSKERPALLQTELPHHSRRLLESGPAPVLQRRAPRHTHSHPGPQRAGRLRPAAKWEGGPWWLDTQSSKTLYFEPVAGLGNRLRATGET